MQLQWSKGWMWMGTRLQYAHVIHTWINGVMINRELASADHWQLSCAPGWTENDYKKQTWNNEKLCQRNLKINKEKFISSNSVMKTKQTHFSKKWQKWMVSCNSIFNSYISRNTKILLLWLKWFWSLSKFNVETLYSMQQYWEMWSSENDNG